MTTRVVDQRPAAPAKKLPHVITVALKNLASRPAAMFRVIGAIPRMNPNTGEVCERAYFYRPEMRRNMPALLSVLLRNVDLATGLVGNGLKATKTLFAEAGLSEDQGYYVLNEFAALGLIVKMEQDTDARDPVTRLYWSLNIVITPAAFEVAGVAPGEYAKAQKRRLSWLALKTKSVRDSMALLREKIKSRKGKQLKARMAKRDAQAAERQQTRLDNAPEIEQGRLLHKFRKHGNTPTSIPFQQGSLLHET